MLANFQKWAQKELHKCFLTLQIKSILRYLCKGQMCVKHLPPFSEMVTEIKGVQVGSLSTRHKTVIGCKFELCDRHSVAIKHSL